VTGDSRRKQERVVEEERQKIISRNSKKNNGDQQKNFSEKRRKQTLIGWERCGTFGTVVLRGKNEKKTTKRSARPKN